MLIEKVLVVIDMQNDFITGVFGTKEAQEIVPTVVKLIRSFSHLGNSIVFTQDYHSSINSGREEKVLPKHCWAGTDGYKFPEEINKLFNEVSVDAVYSKSTFGSTALAKALKDMNPKEIYLCGLCTDICVISNALLLRAFCPDTPIYVHANACAGTTPSNHQKALDIMRQNLIEII